MIACGEQGYNKWSSLASKHHSMGIIVEERKQPEWEMSEKMIAKIGGCLWVNGRQNDKLTTLGCLNRFLGHFQYFTNFYLILPLACP